MHTGWLIVFDATAVVASYFLALFFRFGAYPPEPNLVAVERSIPLLVTICLILAHLYGLYEQHPMTWPEQAQSIFVLVVLNTVLAMAGIFVARTFAVPRSVILIAASTELCLMYAYRRLLYNNWTARHGPPRLILLTPDELSGTTPPIIGASFSVVSHLSLNTLGSDPTTTVLSAVAAAGADGLILHQDLPGLIKEDLALLTVEHELDLFIVPRLLDLMILQSRPSMFGDRLVINLTGSAGSGYQRTLKRFIDVCFAGVFLLVTSPVIVLAALLVFLEDGFPILYRQQRMGLAGQPFTVYKLRTMVRDAEAASGPILAQHNDPRLTRVGRWLRMLHIDELPQLWNVLRGEMSLVGPRPERPELHQEVVATVPHFSHRLRILPGITGLAQVQGHYHTIPLEKLKFDVLYSLRANVVLDLQILLRTLGHVLGTLLDRRHKRTQQSGERP